jgi:DNA repair protein RecN (Recombination protein N)
VLASLTIRNFVLIEDAVLDFAPGLTVLTGETGAGKTLLTRALGLLMGERAEDGLVGNAAEEAWIQAVFTPSAGSDLEIPADLREVTGLDAADVLIVTRRLGRAGRNRCYVNDTAVTLTSMAAIVGTLLSFAGQHEYRRLLDPLYQLEVLDRWAGPDTVALASRYQATYQGARDAARRLQEALASREARLRELDLLRFQVAELAAARLSPEDEAALLAEQRVLSSAEQIIRNLGLAAELLKSEGEVPEATGLLTQAEALLSEVASIDVALARWADTLCELRERLVDLARDLRHYADRVTLDPERLRTVDERLRTYTDLGRKYGGSTEAAVAFVEAGRRRLELLEQGEDDLARLQTERDDLTAEALALAAALRASRAAAIPSLEEAVAAQLADLGMAPASVLISLEPREGWEGLRETGSESVEFLLSANPGQPPRSLARTASGGELSRVLLGLKCALAEAGGDETLVFDEIDAGIGGRTAVAVAQKLRELSERSQLVVVTHLAQVAALADRHFLIDKSSEPSRAVTRLSELSGEAVVRELCRMMGGRPEDTEAMAHARQLRDRAKRGLLD